MNEQIDENYEIIDADSWELKRDMISKFQELSGRKLTESSPETLIFETVAYMIGLREEKYNDEMKQNYLRFARNERLDLRGEIYGSRGKRLSEQSAKSTFRFSISAIQSTDITIPKNSRIRYNELYFSTNEELKITKGNLFVDGIATCNTVGKVGNDIPVGQIKEMVDLFPHYKSVENITVSNGGSDIEDDNIYRERIRILPESFSVAGSSGAYEFWTKSASQSILDVKVRSQNPCEVDIYVWTDIGLPTSELKDRIYNVVNSDHVRPLTDKVTIKEPEVINYDINLSYYINSENEMLVNTIKSNVSNEINSFINWQKEKLGRDINTDELIKRLKLAGVKRVEIISPFFKKIEYNQVAVCKNMTVNYQGVEND